jgi:predicted metal-dependent hydrolase
MTENPQFQRGIAEFNREQFFECHDTLEELWMETGGRDRLFLQGLIQASVGLYHFFNGNYKGASSQMTKALGKLDGYRPAYAGIDLERFTQQVVASLALAERRLAGNPVDTEDIIIPKIQVVQHQR